MCYSWGSQCHAEKSSELWMVVELWIYEDFPTVVTEIELFDDGSTTNYLVVEVYYNPA